jgi:hypothetical protein
MDFGKILSRAWEITWHWKVLWIFGFLASLGQGWGGSTSSYSVDSRDFNMAGLGQGPPGAFWAAMGGVVLAIICVLFLLAIAIWIVSIISRGALIAGVVQVEDEEHTAFRRAWDVGFHRFWTLFGLAVLAALPLLALVLVGLVLFGLGIAGGVSLLDVQEAAGIGTIVTTSLFFACFLCCGLVVLGIVLDQIRVYGERAAILEGLGWIDAFMRGWQVIRDNLGPTIVLWLIFFALGLVVAVISAALALVLVAPFLVLVGVTEGGAWSLIPVACGGFLGLIIFALVRSVVTTYISSSWTLAFRELTARPAVAEVEVAGV